jgi:hypothetical protein
VKDLICAVKIYHPEPFVWNLNPNKSMENQVYGSIESIYNVNILTQAIVECEKQNIRFIIHYADETKKDLPMNERHIEKVTFYYINDEGKGYFKVDDEIRYTWFHGEYFRSGLLNTRSRYRYVPYNKFIPCGKA